MIGMCRYFKKLFKNTQGLGSKKNELNQVLEEFFCEIKAYRTPLARAMVQILGEPKSFQAIDRLNSLENEGGYVTDPQIMRSMGSFFVGNERDLGFYVITSHDSDVKFSIDDHGILVDGEPALHAKPVFLFWPEAILHTASAVPSDKLPEYFSPWIHEFGHFLGYWLQDRPLLVAMSLVSGELKDQGFDIRSLDDLSVIHGNGKGEIQWKLARMLVLWSALNEAIAIWWEEKLLTLMGFELGDYLAAKKSGNPYVDQIETMTEKNALDYIKNWHHSRYYGEDFTKAFLESFGAIEIEKWGLPMTSADYAD